MGLIQKLKNKTVFLDTAPLIYYIEENQQYSPILNKLFLANSKGEFLFQTSVITLLEILVHPMRENKHQLVEEYQNILCNSSTINIFELNIEIAKRAAGFRAKYGLKTPDSIQVATAVYTSAEYFLTNDFRLKAVKEIETLVLDELVKI
ncbi:MAG: type II toxin-antitoxin system VapC family toxin [Bacteroidales bacterium]|nr:type II toxin-antitoxin system VapC family toxin [Bacteroidales bacterium]